MSRVSAIFWLCVLAASAPVESFSLTSSKIGRRRTSTCLQSTFKHAEVDEASDTNKYLSAGFQEQDMTEDRSPWSYEEFAKSQPFANNILISTTKSASADFLAQTVFSQTPIMELDVSRSLLFGLYGALYLGAFQYAYQVGIFNKLFDVTEFTNLPWKDKLKDEDGLKALVAQTVLDMTVVAIIALPTFYTFKAFVAGGASMDISQWFSTGFHNYQENFFNDESRILKVWVPANLLCFSVPLYLRLPVRHAFSFVWTTYFSFIRGGA